MTDDLVSVIIPAFDAEAFLSETLDSVLAQDYAHVEVIVVDDGSSDGTAAIATERPVRLLRQSHRGPAAARNTGLAAADGEYVTVLDADDLWPVDRLSRQVAYLEGHPEVGIVLGLTEFFLHPGARRPEHFSPILEGRLIPGTAGTMLARRAVFGVVGAFDESLWLSEDVDWLARAKDAGVTAAALEHLLLRYRMHAANTSRDNAANSRALLGVLRRSVARQREGADV